jgi:hypothetical protein
MAGFGKSCRRSGHVFSARFAFSHSLDPGIGTEIGDNYSAQWVAGAWSKAGVSYVRSDIPKSQIYRRLRSRNGGQSSRQRTSRANEPARHSINPFGESMTPCCTASCFSDDRQ